MVKLKCDKCGAEVYSGKVNAQGDGVPTILDGANVPMYTVTFPKPDTVDWVIYTKPSGNRVLLCATCKAALDALLAGF